MRVAHGQRLLAAAVLTCTVAACGSTSATGGDASAVEDAATADATSGADGAADGGATADGATTDGAMADGAAPSDASASVDVPTAATSPAVQQCGEIAAQLCAAAKTCCDAGTSATCVADQTEACLKAGFAGLDDPSAAGTVHPDPVRAAACSSALDAAAKGCDRVAFQAARRLCLLAWTDAAKVGDDCAATAPIACDGGAGRCDPVTMDTYTCKKAGADGDGCKLGAPCGIALECLNSTLTRAMKCGKPGSTCHLSDVCPQGAKCDASESCVPWSDGGKTGAACKADGDCAVGWACSAGATCAPSLCGL